MNDRTNEIIKKLNRISNDRVIPRQARNQIQEAANYIKTLNEQVQELGNLQSASDDDNEVDT